MAGPPDVPPPATGLCAFGMRRLPPLLDAFEKEIEGVRQAEDIEYIHRMRVASRRLRAALPLFRSCFPAKQYGKWMEEMANITRALGEARDADVQIAFLVKFRKKAAAAWKKKSGQDPAAENPLAPGTAFLLAELKRKRDQLQARVLTALDALEKSGALPGMRDAILARIAAGRRTRAEAGAYGIPTIAAFRIVSRLAAMRSFEPWVDHPDAVAEHHAMRIAAKKLRYTMEAYAPLYRLALAKPLARVKKVQEILGDIHDNDVWIDHVTRLLLRERSLLRTRNEEKRPDTTTLASLRLFLQDRERERNHLHRHFVRFWQSLLRQGTWEELRRTLTDGRRKRYIPARTAGEGELRSASGALAAAWPEGLGHQRTVTLLALMLFDGLRPVHGLGPRDRILLECAGMLHDIGWAGGAKRHNARSARAIFAAEILPLDIAERSEVGLVALAHRGQVRIASHPLFALLPPGRRESVLRLAALLRVADGLDYLHAGTVQEIHAIIGSREIACDVIAPVDVAREKERARAKADLFARVYGRELVIR